MSLDPSIKGLFGKLIKKGLTVTRIAELFDTTRQTVQRWLKRAKHVGREYFKDKPREPKPGKVTYEVELSILALRNTFKWGTARIQQGLRLSRESINNVLARQGLNGYPREYKRWKFFRAEAPDELWKIDFKGPFTVQGRKYWFLVCIDDYSRYLVLAEQFDHEPKTEEVTALLERQKRQPKAVLSDHGSQFRETWKKWCRQNGVEARYAHPSYPQDKGKVERCIQSLNREFVNHLRDFPGWLKGRVHEYREWFNNSRCHRSIKALPADLYECNVRNLT